jgi:glycosyltransferase involved in cell wall biosynthesis
MNPKKISIVIPIYNEAEVLEELCAQLAKVADGHRYEFEFIFVNDGSGDDSIVRLFALSRSDSRIIGVDLSRNFGQHAALTAGIEQACGDAVILMDADFEDNPEHVNQLLAAWDEGYDVVYALRGKRKSSWLRQTGSWIFHQINSRLEYEIPMAGTFSLMDRSVVGALRLMPERNRYIPGLRTIVGFKQKGIVLARGARYDQRPRVSVARLARLAILSWVSFSKLPLKVLTFMGLFLCFVSFVATGGIVFYQIVMRFSIPGWASLIVTIAFTSGIQLLSLGIIGEYIGQILDEVKGRPIYLVRQTIRGGAIATLVRSGVKTLTEPLAIVDEPQ